MTINSPGKPSPTLLLTPRQAAAALSISPRSLWAITTPRGDLPCARINRSVRYAVRDLELWIDKQKQQKNL